MATQADPNKVAVLKDAMSRASKLMKLESNGTLNKIAKGHQADINSAINDPQIITEDIMSIQKAKNTQAPQPNMMTFGANADNVPSVIRESFMKNPIDSAPLYQGLGDNKDMSFLTEMIQPKQQMRKQSQESIKQIVNEGLPQYQGTQGQQIDYPMIRTIVEEIVRKYAVSLKNKIITEGKDNSNNTLNTLSIGKTFKFLDNAGNIYECTMRKISNINEMKNKKKEII